MRNISFALTTDQIRNRSKTVTRRIGWGFLKPGDRLCAIVKGQGLKKGEKVERLGEIEVVAAYPIRLDTITEADVVREGFPGMKRTDFIEMFCRSHRDCTPQTRVTRIEFKYV